jgi:hypothetical protein
MQIIYPSGSHDAVAISPVPHGTAPEIFSRNLLRIADKPVRGDDSIVESNHRECPRIFHFRTEPVPLASVPSTVVHYLEAFYHNMYPEMHPRTSIDQVATTPLMRYFVPSLNAQPQKVQTFQAFGGSDRVQASRLTIK